MLSDLFRLKQLMIGPAVFLTSSTCAGNTTEPASQEWSKGPECLTDFSPEGTPVSEKI